MLVSKNYDIDDIIEDCPVTALSSADCERIEDTNLYNYYFSWGENRNGAAIAPGHNSLYNYSYSPNIKYIKLTPKDMLITVAYCEIKPGDEIKVNYNENPTSDKELWFEVKP